MWYITDPKLLIRFNPKLKKLYKLTANVISIRQFIRVH